ncbi:hypothetical protein G3A_13875 [Bacillus sp. 17376]|uniref:Uncharacterized protein n=1 Tax=Mesobacillus boroniphilus JCM 21738 TaxID=1294265 RepID=W4RMJ3_9BACI|nr:hypothetical protein [Mesobacillus boroniphilus]ESU31990.1 hypothetical protein G3A_13875 [Bacillus sp. 17376]GAE45526.1 hypothetical protein JCM21738_2339 [Mesobacillus boroniphilus JCM 21738]
MITIEDLKKEFELIKDKPKFQKMLDFASILTSYFEQENIKPIVVGSLSVPTRNRNLSQGFNLTFATGTESSASNFFLIG